MGATRHLFVITSSPTHAHAEVAFLRTSWHGARATPPDRGWPISPVGSTFGRSTALYTHQSTLCFPLSEPPYRVTSSRSRKFSRAYIRQPKMTTQNRNRDDKLYAAC